MGLDALVFAFGCSVNLPPTACVTLGELASGGSHVCSVHDDDDDAVNMMMQCCSSEHGALGDRCEAFSRRCVCTKQACVQVVAVTHETTVHAPTH